MLFTLQLFGQASQSNGHYDKSLRFYISLLSVRDFFIQGTLIQTVTAKPTKGKWPLDDKMQRSIRGNITRSENTTNVFDSQDLWTLLVHLSTALKTPAAFHEQIRSLERARVRRHCPHHRHSSRPGFLEPHPHYVLVTFVTASHFVNRQGTSWSTKSAADLNALSWSVCTSYKVTTLLRPLTW